MTDQEKAEQAAAIYYAENTRTASPSNMFLAGVRWAQEYEQERANILLEALERIVGMKSIDNEKNDEFATAAEIYARSIALAALAKYRGSE